VRAADRTSLRGSVGQTRGQGTIVVHLGEHPSKSIQNRYRAVAKDRDRYPIRQPEEHFERGVVLPIPGDRNHVKNGHQDQEQSTNE
jgi:hypothetical protein